MSLVSIYLLVLILTTIQLVQPAKIAIFTMQFTGHLSEFGGIGSALVKRGHEVHIVMDRDVKKPPQITQSGMKILEYVTSDKSGTIDVSTYDRRMMGALLNRSDDVFDELFKPRVEHDCLQTLHNNDLISRFLDHKFDFVLSDGLYFCYTLIPYKYNIPFAVVGTPHYAYLTRIHPLLAACPCNVKDENHFMMRLKMLGYSLIFETLSNWFLTESNYMDYVPERPYKSLWEIQDRAALHILNQNNLVDCPRPGMPNVIYAGGMNVESGKKLPSELESFVSSAKDGVVVMSLGSIVAEMPPKFANIFLRAFSKIKQRVVWRFLPNGELKGVKFPDNVKVMDWLPQNDLLAHRNTKVFITHCGNNGNTEGVYHGVPMLAVPLEGDQFYNAYRTVSKNHGLQIDMFNLEADEIARKITDLVENPKYKQAIGKSSEIFQSQQHPAEYAAYWIEHVIKFGSDHLKTALTDMNTFQYLMIDIYVFVTVVVALLITLIVFIIRKCCVSKKGKKKQA